MVRVEGKEYGPVDLEELRAWREDGRLIRANEVREEGTDRWFPAAELPEVFADEPVPAAAAPAAKRLTFGEIFGASWRIYRRGFGRFFALSLLVSIPSFFLQLAAPFLQTPDKNNPVPLVVVSTVIAFAMLMLLIITWPFSLAGLQLLAADLFAGRDPSLRVLLTRAKPLWTRMFTVGLVVYGSYFLWTVLPLLFAFTLAAGGSGGGLLVTFLLLFFVAYMVARLFINFLFWQPAGALGGHDAMGALRESKELARSGTDRPRGQRPLYRGAIIASVWLLVIIGLNLAIEIPVMLWRLRGVTSVDQALPLIEALAKSNSLDFLSGLTTLLSCLVSALLRGWLAAIFVVLYLDTK